MTNFPITQDRPEAAVKSNGLKIIGCLGSLALCAVTFGQAPEPDLPLTEPFSLPLPSPDTAEPGPIESEPPEEGPQGAPTQSSNMPDALEPKSLPFQTQPLRPAAEEKDGNGKPLEELSQESPPPNNREVAMADAAKRFGSFGSINEITINVKLPPQGAQSLPQLFAVRASQADEVEYLSPPLHRPWENSVLRPHARVAYEPLYFEEVNLERYGLRRPIIQPACSAAHFFGGILMLPYKVTRDPAHLPFFHHHPYLPGVNGCERKPFRLEAGPAIVQATAATGLFFISP